MMITPDSLSSEPFTNNHDILSPLLRGVLDLANSCGVKPEASLFSPSFTTTSAPSVFTFSELDIMKAIDSELFSMELPNLPSRSPRKSESSYAEIDLYGLFPDIVPTSGEMQKNQDNFRLKTPPRGPCGKEKLPNVSKASANTAGKVKRPVNRFMLWTKVRRPQIAREHRNLCNKEVSRILGAEWAAMSEDAKAPYTTAALEGRKRHKEENPDFQYRGVKACLPNPVKIRKEILQTDGIDISEIPVDALNYPLLQEVFVVQKSSAWKKAGTTPLSIDWSDAMAKYPRCIVR